MKFFCVILLTLSFSLLCISQTNNKQENLLLIPKRSSAYITFEKFGIRKPRYQGESEQGIWLRLHNNTKWNLTVKTLACRNIQEECLVFYEVKRMYSDKSEIKESAVPTGYRMAHISSEQTIPSGNSVLFNIPKEHLAEGLYIVVDFNYEWEAGGGSSIFHKVPFYSTDLPKEKKN